MTVLAYRNKPKVILIKLRRLFEILDVREAGWAKASKKRPCASPCEEFVSRLRNDGKLFMVPDREEHDD
ncbi:hypothetical protein [Sphingomonas sp. PB1R3]|uniref:hypothetical protein n=1 Tax=Sphingomonas flavida TaxID=3096154 RepID=UPI002FCC9788